MIDKSWLPNFLNSNFLNSPWDDEPSEKQPEEENIFLRKNKSKKKVNMDFGNGDFLDSKFIFILLGILAALWLASGFYKVTEGEQAIVLRFGKLNRVANPGLNYHLPMPVEKVIIEKVDKSRRIEIGYRSGSSSTGFLRNNTSTAAHSLPEESVMLTGDENIVDLNCDVIWRINDVEKYVFNVVNPEQTVKIAAESAIREVIGNTPITFVLSNKKQEIALKVEQVTQHILDLYNTGVQIDKVQLLKAEPPAEVIDSYRDVQTSKADKEREINQAQAFQNDILPKARGEAEKILQDAEGYKKAVIAKAEGESNRFSAILKEYQTNKQVTKERLYQDMMSTVLKGSDKVIVDQQGLLPHMSIQSKGK